MSWIIRLSGTGAYSFCLTDTSHFLPAEGREIIKVPDATPEIINRYAMDDEQALLAKVRYNRLVDIFLGIASYSLQNHLRTSLPNIGQVETDELYVGVSRGGSQFIIPVQAKGGKDKIGIVQIEQDYWLCREKYPNLVSRPIAVQFLRGEQNVIAMFEFKCSEDEISVADERHYRLVPQSDITQEDLQRYNAIS